MKSFLPGLLSLMALGCLPDPLVGPIDCCTLFDFDASTPEVEEPDASEPEPWECLRHAPPADSSAELTFLLRAVDMMTRQPPAGLSAMVCARDSACDPPLAGPFPGQGEVLSLWLDDVPAAGFDGFIRIEGLDVMPIELQWARPLRRNLSMSPDEALEMIPEKLISGFGGDVKIDRAKGLFWLQVFDCQDKPAEGVRFVALPAIDATFFKDEPFDFEVGGWGTGLTGSGGLLNVRPGAQRVHVMDSVTDEELFAFDLTSRPGTMAVARVHAADL